MEVKSTITYSELVDLVKHLPADKKVKLRSELTKTKPVKKKKSSKQSLPDLLLNGPTMSKIQYTAYKELRKQMNKWRAA